MITGPLFKWFGSKWSAAPLYPKPTCSQIFEPFAGSAGYALRYAHLDITIWDTNPFLQVLWKWLIHEASYADIMAIPTALIPALDIRQMELTEGQMHLLKCFQYTNNTFGCWKTSPWVHVTWTASVRERVANEVAAIKHWKFEPIDYFQWGTYFIDPPYLYNYRYGAKDFNHFQLARFLHRIPDPCQIIVCEAVCPKTNEVPSYLPFQPFAKRVTSRRKAGNNVYSKELLYYREGKL